MAKKMIKKIVSGILAVAATVSSVGLFTACETSHPEVEIQLEFNGVTYTLDYTLYRNCAPATVRHFLTLAENNYYDGLCVHNYSTTRLTTGGYYYEAGGENGGLTEKDYYTTVASTNFKNFTSTVYKNSARTESTYTLKGEFTTNDFKVEGTGAKKETFGSLTMYYTAKKAENNVWVKRSSPDSEGNEYDEKNYKYNSATSLFYISLSTSTKSNSDYCTFATVGSSGKTALENLQSAITTYVETELTGENNDFTESVTVRIDEDDFYAADEENSAEYEVPKMPITVKYVRVKKY